MPILVTAQAAGCCAILLFCLAAAIANGVRLFELQKSEEMLSRVVTDAATAAEPAVVRSTRPLLRVRRANANAALSEQFNTLFGERGIVVQSVTVQKAQAFRPGMTAYSVRVAGRAEAPSLASALHWLAANPNGVAVQRVVAEPVQAGARPELADVGIDFIVLAVDQ
jgi:hypothetical protein